MTEKTEKTAQAAPSSNKPKRSFKTKVLILLLLILIILGSSIGYMTRFKQGKALDRVMSPPISSSSLPQKPQAVKNTTVVAPETASSEKRKTSVTAITSQDKSMKDQLFQPEASLSTTPTDKRATTPSPLPSVATPSTLPLKNTAAPSAQTISPSKTAETLILPQTVPQPAEKVFFSLDDALAFRDHLMTGANCREDLEKVIQIYPRTPLLTRVIETTEPFCISPQTSAGPLDDLIESFLRAKRQARLAYYHATHAVGLAYLKALGTAFVEIRNLNADDTTPLGIFDRAETALEQHNLRRALTEIHKLSPVYQAYFADFKSGADAYLAAQKNLNALVLSFGKKED